MKTIDAAPAVVMLGLSAGVIVGTRGLPVWSEFTPGPAFAPLLVAGAGALVSISLLVQAWRSTGPGRVEWPGRTAAARIVLTTAGLAASVLLSPYLGIVTTAVAFTLCMLFGILRRSLWWSVVTSAVTGGLIYGVFIYWLGVALPTGPLGF